MNSYQRSYRQMVRAGRTIGNRLPTAHRLPAGVAPNPQTGSLEHSRWAGGLLTIDFRRPPTRSSSERLVDWLLLAAGAMLLGGYLAFALLH